MSVRFQVEGAQAFFQNDQIESFLPALLNGQESFIKKQGEACNLLGWHCYPCSYPKEELSSMEQMAKKVQQEADVLLVVGVGGSYLGCRAGLEFLFSASYDFLPQKQPKVYFVGHHFSGQEFELLHSFIQNSRVVINVISKSGQTMETAAAFSILEKWMEEKYGPDYYKRIICTTDGEEGKLLARAKEKNYACFAIPKSMGGRFSVLSPVGLFPLAVAGASISQMVEGAKEAYYDLEKPTMENPAFLYAALRQIFLQQGKQLELFCAYEPCLHSFLEWLKQLFAESEGKEGKGIFPVAAHFTTDLHSLGQYIQEGQKILFETVLWLDTKTDSPRVPSQNMGGEEPAFVGKTLNELNRCAFLGTREAHVKGGVPNLLVEISGPTEKNLGYLFYFFEKVCALSGTLLGVDPFHQPGVELYKNNMKNLLIR